MKPNLRWEVKEGSASWRSQLDKFGETELEFGKTELEMGGEEGLGLFSALFDNGRIYNFEQAFGAKDLTTPEMRAAIRDWTGLYYQTTPTQEEDPCQRIPVAVVNKLTKTTFSEYTAMAVGRNTGAAFVAQVLAALEVCRKQAMQQALIGGQCFLKPNFTAGGLQMGVISRGNYLALGRDGQGRLTDLGTAERVVQGQDYYTLLERRRLGEDGRLTIESRLYRSDSEQILGTEIPLATLPQYAALQPVLTLPEPLYSLGLIPLCTPMENCVDGSASSPKANWTSSVSPNLHSPGG